MSSKWKIEKHRSGNCSITNNNSWIAFPSKEELRDLYESLGEFIIKEDAPFQVGDRVRKVSYNAPGFPEFESNIVKINGDRIVLADGCPGLEYDDRVWPSSCFEKVKTPSKPIKKIKTKKKRVRCPFQKGDRVSEWDRRGRGLIYQGLVTKTKSIFGKFALKIYWGEFQNTRTISPAMLDRSVWTSDFYTPRDMKILFKHRPESMTTPNTYEHL